MQQKVKRLQAQLRDLKDFQVVNYEREISHLKTTYKNLFDSITSNRAYAKLHNLIYENAKLRARLFENTSKSMNNTLGMSVTPHVDKPKLIAVTPHFKKLHELIPLHSVPQPREFNIVKHSNVIALGMFKIDPPQTSRVDMVPNKQSGASIRTNPITNFQRHVTFKENVSSDTNILHQLVEFHNVNLGLVHTARTRRPQPKGNTRNARVPSTSKSSEVKKNVTVKDHRRTLLLYKNQKTMSSECNNIKLAIWNDKSKFVCGTCKQCLVTANHDACLLSSVNALNSHQGKSKRASHPPKPVPNSKQRLHLLHMDLCGPITKDEMPEVIKNFLKNIYVRLQAPVIIVRTNNGAEFKNYALKEYFDSVGIIHETSAAKTPQKSNISYLHVFWALCYLKNDREDIGKLGAKSDIGFFIGYSTNSMAYKVYNQRTKKIMETMNVTFDELSAMAFEQNNFTPAPTNSSNTPVSSHDVDAPLQQHAQQQGNHSPSRTASATDNVPNAVFEGDLFVNLFATPSTESVVSSTQYVDPLNMHTFYQPYPHDYQWTKDHPLEQVIGEPSRPVLTRNQLKTDGDMCIYALTVSIMEPKSVKEALTDPAWIESIQEELHQFIRLDVWELVLSSDAPRALYDELSTFLPPNGFSKGTIDPTLFTRRFDDDILVVNQSPNGIFINQFNYVHEILKKYGLNTCDIIGTPMYIKDKLDLDQIRTPVDATKYRSMIGALIYLTSSRPDIVHATCDSSFELTGFLDADYARCKDTFKSTFGGAQILGEKLVSWSLKKQECTSLLTAKSEYVSLSACCAQVI
uniref:Retroviral polymerase SH3-like domain-containing protein n=1 Tax=Tanacetum cinerariifolium TaxID=118510 RepID=A0A6L2PB38_TANCI|nr:hypothetical protein [Tanacetum cinerariifolium]